MRAKDLMCAKAKDGILLIEGLKDYHLRVLGATMPCSSHGTDTVNSFYLTPIKDQKGLVSVHVCAANHAKVACFFLNVDFSGQEPIIDLENQWLPQADRLGQVYDRGIEVMIESILFSSRLCFDSRLPENYVAGDVLCRYLIGEISAEDVHQAVTNLADEISARAKLPELEESVKRYQTELETVTADRDEFKHVIHEKTQKLDLMADFTNHLRDLVKQLEKSLASKWFLSKKDKQLLESLNQVSWR